jgi:hypothetical protein
MLVSTTMAPITWSSGVVDREDILDHRRAVAEHFALAPPAAAAVERLHQQRLFLGVEQTRPPASLR